MSSKTKFWRNIQAWLVVLVSLLLLIWYANPQLLFSLIFPYQIVEWFFPDVGEMLRALIGA
jgi:hypothetical protein